MKQIFLIAALLIASSAGAQNHIGYDVLGVAKYCKRFLKAPQLPAMSTLMNTFGDSLKCVDKRAQMGNLSVVQIDLIDATCWRNRVCPPGVPAPDDLQAIRKRAKEVQSLADKFPNVKFWVSPALEHDIKNPETVKKMMNAAQAGCPKCSVINSPFTGAKPSGFNVELHGTKITAFSISGDGASSFDADNLTSDGNNFEHRTAGTYSTFLWWNELNLRCSGESKFTAPKERTEKPTIDQFKQAYAIAQPEPPFPSQKPGACQIIDTVKAPEIYKPNAESYCNGATKDPRGNKPLLIIKKAGKKGDRIKALAPNGREAGCFKYWGPFPDIPGAHRWYMGDCSGQTPAALMSDFGGEWGYVSLGDGRCLRINAVRRMGAYR